MKSEKQRKGRRKKKGKKQKKGCLRGNGRRKRRIIILEFGWNEHERGLIGGIKEEERGK